MRPSRRNHFFRSLSGRRERTVDDLITSLSDPSTPEIHSWFDARVYSKRSIKPFITLQVTPRVLTRGLWNAVKQPGESWLLRELQDIHEDCDIIDAIDFKKEPKEEKSLGNRVISWFGGSESGGV